MNNVDALYAEILARPHDLTVRLAYADALRERGQCGDLDRAEFIRLQITQPEREAEIRELWGRIAKQVVRCPEGWKVSKGGRKRLYLSLDFHDATEACWSYLRAHATAGFADVWEADQSKWDRVKEVVQAANPVRELRLEGTQYLIYEGDDAFRFEREPDRLYSLSDVEEMRGRYRGTKPTDDIGLLYLIRNPGLVVSERLNRLPGRASEQEYSVRWFRQGGVSPLVIWQCPVASRRLEEMATLCESEGLPPGTRIAVSAWTTGGKANDFYRHDPRVRHYPPGLTPQSA